MNRFTEFVMRNPIRRTLFWGQLAAVTWTFWAVQTPAKGQSLPSGIDAIPVISGSSLLPSLAEEEQEEKVLEKPPWWSVRDWPRETKVIALNAGTVATITAIGFAGWDYGSHSFNTANEGWFGPRTPYGGADKLGHLFTCYALASAYNRIYQDWGYSDNDAILIGAGSSWLTMSLIEVGDAFSKSEGYSWQDEVMNTAGVGMAYLHC